MNLIPIPAGMETGFFAMSRGALADVPELLHLAFPGKTPWVIADENTWKNAGEQVQKALIEAGMNAAAPEIFPGNPRLHPDYGISCRLAEKMSGDLVPVAVGSGVLNDLVKCAAGIAQIPYCCVATAASVDGYTAYGGAMSVQGLKKTVPCPAPYALLVDLDVLESAPPEMLASGYADLLTKVPAGADWLIAAELGLEPVRDDVWQMVQQNLRQWVADSRNLSNVFMGLAATGYAMQMYRDSRPASGAEHMFSHVWEMEKLSFHGEEISHGFKVGIGTVAVAQLMDFVVRTPVTVARKMAAPLMSLEERKVQIAELLKKDCYGTGIPEVALEKFLTGNAALERREQIFGKWEILQEKIRQQIFPVEEFRRLLRSAGAPDDYRQIGLDREQYCHGIRTAQLIRKRYTVLDLLFETGLLEQAIASLE